MKTTTALVALTLAASCASAAVAPRPTAHSHLAKRQQFPDGVDLSALLADPSSYLSGVSKAVKANPTYAAAWASVTNDPAFHQSISSALVDQFGTKTAKIALAQYTDAPDAECDASSTSAAAAAASPVAQNADVSDATSAQALQQVSNGITSGAGSAVPTSMYAVALAAAPAIMMIVL